MSRPLRIEFAGAFYHVMSRGVAKRDIVVDDVDRRTRLKRLRKTVEIYGWQLQAFVLMDNHEHLFLQTPEPNLSAGMQHLNGSYSTEFNRRHQRVGHLLQGRFRAEIVEDTSYAREVSRYIHLNPVRAGLTTRPEDWPWSSCAGYFSLDDQLPWVTYEQALCQFSTNPVDARLAYRRFVYSVIDSEIPAPWENAVGGLILGSESFVESIQDHLESYPNDPAVPQLHSLKQRPDLARICNVVARHLGDQPEAWTHGTRSDGIGRQLAAYIARRVYGYPATEVAKALGYSTASSVSHAVRRIDHGRPGWLIVATRLARELNTPPNTAPELQE
jgi:putative transposase